MGSFQGTSPTCTNMRLIGSYAGSNEWNQTWFGIGSMRRPGLDRYSSKHVLLSSVLVPRPEPLFIWISIVRVS
jgi:hypothetical protein